jgi:antibiotic biosynthesis monooxygenase (ABM) superfamily enzyme
MAPQPSPSRPAPSIHVRAVLTWLSIFPLVVIGFTILGAFADGWSPVLRALVLTLAVVPLAVYVFVPLLLSGYVRLTSRLGRGEQ